MGPHKTMSKRRILQAHRRPVFHRSNLPPEINLSPTFTKAYRFQVPTSAASVTISVLELIGALGGICTVLNSTVVHWTTAFRIIALKLYPPAGSNVNPVNAVVEWSSASGYAPDRVMSNDSPGGITSAGRCLVFKPPAKSLASDWVNIVNSSLNLFNLFNAPAGCVIDLVVESAIGVSFSASALSSTVATGTLGQIYYLALDGPSSNKVIPATGMPTTH